MNDKQNMVYTYNGILFSLKERNSDTYYNMDELQTLYWVKEASQKKTV